MHAFSAVTEEVRGFGQRTAQVGESLHRAAATASAALTGDLPAVFGMIGADYLAAYTAAQERYTAAVRALAVTADHTAFAAQCTANCYDDADADHTAQLRQGQA